MSKYVIREFYPVEHGAFYSEKLFDIFRIIYDCGSSSNLSYLTTCINKYVKKDEEIDALFISHLHKDHISGLPELLKRAKVKSIILPYMDDSEKKFQVFIDKLSRDMNNEENTNDSTQIQIDALNVIDIINEFSDETNIIEVQSEIINEDTHIDNLSEQNTPISSGSMIKFTAKSFSWVFKPYSYKNTSYMSKLEAELKMQGIDISKLHDANYYSTNIKKLVKCYENALGSKKRFNIHSMMLLSYAQQSYKWWCGVYSDDIQLHGRMDDSTGCLYCGDADLNKKETIKIVKQITQTANIGLIQIPHHGAVDNYNENIIVDIFKHSKHARGKAIISAGVNSGQKKHPYRDVMAHLLANLITTYIVDRKEICFKYTHYDNAKNP